MKKMKFLRIAIMAFLCIILNIAGHIITMICPLPFWLDAVGTMISACLCGPIVGGTVGFLGNLITRICFGGSPIIFSLINILIGVVVGILSKKGLCGTLFGALCTGILLGIIAVICATPVNCLINDGKPNNLWGDALFEMLSQYRIGTPFKAVISQMFLEIPDKVLSMAFAYAAARSLRRKFADKQEDAEDNGENAENEV